eukprot:SAG31_NODE_1543_length_7944_cov_8.711281_6_plen_130_part_00
MLQAYQHSRDTRLLNGFMAQADTTVRFQDEHGLWMRWTPNDNSTGYLHPRYNLWCVGYYPQHEHVDKFTPAPPQVRILAGRCVRGDAESKLCASCPPYCHILRQPCTTSRWHHLLQEQPQWHRDRERVR